MVIKMDMESLLRRIVLFLKVSGKMGREMDLERYSWRDRLR